MNSLHTIFDCILNNLFLAEHQLQSLKCHNQYRVAHDKTVLHKQTEHTPADVVDCMSSMRRPLNDQQYHVYQ
jgi:hypothetical protein